MLQLLGNLAILLCGLYFISLGLSHVRPQVFATVGSVAVSGINAQMAGGGAIFLGVMLFLNDFLSGKVTGSLIFGLASIAVGVLWVRSRRIDIVARQAQPLPVAGWCYLAVGLVTAFFGVWAILPA